MISFLLYFIITGLIMYLLIMNTVNKLNKDSYKLTDKQREEIQELRQLIFYNFGTSFDSILPILQLIGLLLGWILIPAVIILQILQLFGVKVDNFF